MRKYKSTKSTKVQKYKNINLKFGHHYRTYFCLLTKFVGFCHSVLTSYGAKKKLHHPDTREGGITEKMILDYMEGRYVL